jgi:glucokinase
MAHYLGLDLGGTNIKAGIIDASFHLIAHTSVPTEAGKGPDAVIENMAAAARSVASRANIDMGDIAGIGIGAPGPLDLVNGIVIAAPNLPGWKNVPLRDRIQKLTGRPAILENDANAAAFGEFCAGAAAGDEIRDMVMLTLGTGVGSGIVVNGKLVHGAFNLAGEAGHMIVNPEGERDGCGTHGCLEIYGSASHTARRATEAVAGGAKSTLSALLKAGPGKITAKDVFQAAEQGDALANQIVDETAKYLGIACVNFCRILDPRMIVFAGGMTLAGDFLFDRIRAAFKRHSWTIVEDRVEIVPATLGNDAGVIGAAAVAWDAYKSGELMG